MAFMRICTLLAVALVASWAAPCPPTSATQEAAPETVRPYVPPAASKSVEIGDFYFRRKKYRGALSRYQEAIHTDPDYAPAYLGLGRAYEKMRLDQKALEAYHRYLDALPSTKEAEEAKEAHRAIERLEKKLKDHRPARKQQPGPP